MEGQLHIQIPAFSTLLYFSSLLSFFSFSSSSSFWQHSLPKAVASFLFFLFYLPLWNICNIWHFFSLESSLSFVFAKSHGSYLLKILTIGVFFLFSFTSSPDPESALPPFLLFIHIYALIQWIVHPFNSYILNTHSAAATWRDALGKISHVVPWLMCLVMLFSHVCVGIGEWVCARHTKNLPWGQSWAWWGEGARVEGGASVGDRHYMEEALNAFCLHQCSLTITPEASSW